MTKKKKAVTAAVAVAIFSLFIGSGAMILNRVKSDRNEILSLANDYADKQEYLKALGILEALAATNKNNKEIAELISIYKKKQAELELKNIKYSRENSEQQFIDRIKDIAKDVEDALAKNELYAADLLKNEILKLDPTNTLAKSLGLKINETRKEQDKLKDIINNIIDEIQDAFKKNRLKDAENLSNELVQLDPNNPILKTIEDIIMQRTLDHEKIKKQVSDLAQNIYSVIEDSTKDSLDLLSKELLKLDPKNPLPKQIKSDQELNNNKKQDIKNKTDNLEDNIDSIFSENLIIEAEDALDKNNLIKAEALINEVLKIDPQNAVAKELKIRIDRRKESNKILKKAEEALTDNNILEAERLAKEALKVDPDNSLVSDFEDIIKRSKEFQDKVESAKKSFDEGNFSEADKLIKEVLKADPTNFTAKDLRDKLEDNKSVDELLNDAKLAFAQGDEIEAERIIDKVLKREPNNTEANKLKTKIEEKKEIDKLIQEATSALNNNDIEKAEELLNKALEIDSNNADVQELKEKVEDVLKQLSDKYSDKSKELIQEASKVDTTDSKADDLKKEIEDNKDLKDKLLDQAETPKKSYEELVSIATLYRENGDYLKELDTIDDILEIKLTAEYYVKAGIASYKVTKYTNAIGYFQKAINLDNNYPETYYPMALTYARLEDDLKREETLNKGIELRPNHASSQYELGRLYTDHEDYDRALELFIKAKSLDESSVKFQMGVALAYFNLEDYSESIEIYESILSLDKSKSEVYYNLSLARAKISDYDSALTDITKAIEIDPELAKYHYTKGEISEALGDENSAAGHYLNAVKLDNYYYKPMLNLGNIYDRVGRFEDAIKLLQFALKLKPNDPNIKFSLGAAYLHNKDYAESLILLEEAHINDKESAFKLYNLSLAYTEVGESIKAEDGFKRVIELDNNFIDAYYYLGELLFSIDKKDESRTYFQKVLELNPDYIFKDKISEYL
ncbi:MAG: tetratricopeptide repeat protein [Spirochaetaceae bacterium]